MKLQLILLTGQAQQTENYKTFGLSCAESVSTHVEEGYLIVIMHVYGGDLFENQKQYFFILFHSTKQSTNGASLCRCPSDIGT